MSNGRLTKVICFLAAGVALPVAASDPFAELESAVSEQKELSKTEQSDFEAWKAAQRADLEQYMRRIQREFKAYKQMHQAATDAYRGEIATVWEKPETTSKTKWVSYEQDFKRKTIVDFEQDEIRIAWPSTVAEPLSDSGTRKELVRLLKLSRKQAFENDRVAQQVERQGRQNLSAFETGEVPDTPILLTYLFGSADISDQQQANLVDHFMDHRKEIAYQESGQDIQAWVFPLTLPDTEVADQPPVPEVGEEKTAVLSSDGQIWKTRAVTSEDVDRLPAKAKGLLAAINRENQAYDLSVELILAIIETESAFNPMAKSPIPAFGLMQIVPVSAGQDATAKIFGKPRILSPSYLYNPDNNVKIGAAYFNILYYRYFKGINDPLSRLYCSIAAYNTGPGNVSKALTGESMSLKAATRTANRMDSRQVYQHLLANLPYEETVHYLRKVTNRLQKYEAALSARGG